MAIKFDKMFRASVGVAACSISAMLMQHTHTNRAIDADKTHTVILYLLLFCGLSIVAAWKFRRQWLLILCAYSIAQIVIAAFAFLGGTLRPDSAVGVFALGLTMIFSASAPERLAEGSVDHSNPEKVHASSSAIGKDR